MRHSSNKAGKDWTLIFLHIPKTAGLTLFNIIQKQYDSNSIHFHVGDTEYIHKFKEIPQSEKRDIKVLPGHLPFGVHEYLPQPSVYITLLRDPIDRVISNYCFVRSMPWNAVYKEANSKSLKEFLLSGSYLDNTLDNGQTRMLAGMPGITCKYGACTTEILDIAKKNLSNSFSVVGLTERFDETLILLKRVFGWKNLLYVKKNVTEKRLNKEDISSDTLEVIVKYNKLDIELYKYAEELFERAVNQYGLSFERDLKNFRLLKKYYLDAIRTDDVEFNDLENKYPLDVAVAIYAFNKSPNGDNLEVANCAADEIISQFPISHQINIHNFQHEISAEKKLSQAEEFIRQNKMAEARFLLNQMIRLEGYYKIKALNNLSAIELAEGNDEKAIKYIDKVLKLDSKNEDALENLKHIRQRTQISLDNTNLIFHKCFNGDKLNLLCCDRVPQNETENLTTKINDDNCRVSLPIKQEQQMIFLQGLPDYNLQFLIKNIVNSVDSVLDVGCGVGDYLEKFTNSSQRVIAVEPYLPYLDEAKKRAPWAEFKNMDALTYFGQTEEKFECILLIDVVEHLEKNQAVQMVREAIKHSKKMVFCQTPFGECEQHHDQWNMGGDYWQTHKSTWDDSNLDELGFSFYTVWKNWYEWDENQSNKSKDATIAMWISDFSEDKFTILLNVQKQSRLLDLQATLEHVIRQTYPKFEVIIVIDNPSEKAVDLIEKYQAIDSRIKVVTFDNSIDMAGLERMISKKKSGFLLTLECGDELPPNKLERQIKFLKQVDAAKTYDWAGIKSLNDDSYIEALRKDNFKAWRQAYLEGYNSGMGDHRSYFYNKYIEDIGFYREVSRAKRIAEFAPGNGEFFEKFIRAELQKEFFFIDISESNLEYLKSKFSTLSNITYILNNQREIPIAEADTVFSFLLCQSVPKSLWVEHLAQVYDMLGNGGSYFFQFAYHPDGAANDSIGDSIAGSQKYSADQMSSLVRRAGFQSVELTPPINLEPFNTDILWYLCKAIK